MSWITDLAGKAENILNKIDQNAASVLKSETDNVDLNKENRSSSDDISIVEGIRKNLSSSSLSLKKTLSPKKLLKAIDLQGTGLQQQRLTPTTTTTTNDEFLQKTEKSNSRLSSRRSSLSSKTDTNTVIECEISATSSLSTAAAAPLTTTMTESLSSSSSLSFNDKQQQHEQQFNNDFISNDGNFEKEIYNLRKELNDITLERDNLKDEIIQLQNDLIKNKTDLQNTQELENYIKNLNNENEVINNELNVVKNQCNDYIKTINEFEINLANTKQKICELTEKLQLQLKENENNLNELNCYKKKAQITLQIKDKIIAELKCKLNGNDNIDSNNDNNKILNRNIKLNHENENEKILQLEIDELREKNLQLNDKIIAMEQQLNTKVLLQQYEMKYLKNIEEHKKTEEILKNTLCNEQKKILQYESDIKILNNELLNIRDEMHKQREQFSIKLHEKENEIMKLQAIKQADMYKDTTANILENRIKSLTQALVQKQNSIEHLTAERNALKLQVEKIEDKMRQVLSQNRVNRPQIINVNGTDDAKAQLLFLMRENPFDTNVTRRVKRAYSSLDSIGIRVGVLLRRYPLIRISVFMYIALLHLWVMFVLLSSTPT